METAHGRNADDVAASILLHLFEKKFRHLGRAENVVSGLLESASKH